MLYNKDMMKKEKLWEILEERISICTECPLHKGRTNAVPGEGDRNAYLMFVGEGPGGDEDATGRPFVGRAGKLLDKILASAGIDRRAVYITNIVKCRPPKNRTPYPNEVNTCFPYLMGQIELIQPKIIVTLGAPATSVFLPDLKGGITQIRGTWYKWRNGIEIFPMFHPSYLLRNPSREQGSPKWHTWQDIKAVKERLEEIKKLSIIPSQ